MTSRTYLCPPLLLLVALLSALILPLAHAAPVAPPALAAPAAPVDLLGPGGWFCSTPHPGDAALETVALPDAPGGGGQVLRVSVTMPSEPFYLIQLTRGIPSAVPQGDRVRLHFWGRSVTNNPIHVTVERDGPPYDAVAELVALLAPTWQEFTVEGISPGWGAKSLSVHFQMGQKAGVIEVAGAALTDIGVDPALVAARQAIRPEQMRARIEKSRKGGLTVRVVDASGRAVPGAKVHLAMTRHAFLFGGNFFALNPADTSPSEMAYQKEFTGLFNYATLPFYWGAFEGTQGKPDYDRLQGMAAWSVTHGVAPKGHPLVWHQVWPAWAPNTPAAAISLLHARVADLVPRYKDTIHYWDVLNEANGAQYQVPPNGESEWIKRDGPAPVVETALGWARAAAPAGTPETFLYNDYNLGQENVALLTQLQKDGKLPDAIGLQSHMHGGEFPLTDVWQDCERFGRFGRPIHFTETTVISGPHRDNPKSETLADWNTTPEGEARQADYVVQFYTLLFSHPSVRAITWWDFSDLNAWQGAPAGLVRKDMSPKPAYTRLLDLVHKQWWTDTTGKADAKGALTRRVFYGDYAVTVTDAKGRTKTQTVTLPEGGPARTVTVRLP